MRFPFLALLADNPAHGYELKQALEHRFGAALPRLNAGQVYTTLSRLERDGLVKGSDVPDDSRQKRVYELTDAGRAALEEWVDAPTAGPRVRDEFFMKLVLAREAGVADPRRLIERQRREYLQALRDLAAVAPDGNVAASLLVEGASLHLEADLEWLDLCEQRLIKEDS
jgi:DNA-binding PadR family transcriptional regulator